MSIEVQSIEELTWKNPWRQLAFSQSTSFGGIISVLSDDVKTTSFTSSLKTAQPPHSAQWSVPKRLIQKIAVKENKNVSFSKLKVNQKVVHVYLIGLWTCSTTETLANSSHLGDFLVNLISENWVLVSKYKSKTFSTSSTKKYCLTLTIPKWNSKL